MNDGKYKLAVIKISNGRAVPDDEPVFFFRARDKHAIEALVVYRQICIEGGCNDYQIDGIDEAIARFEDFAKLYPEKMKQPGSTRGL
jgi:hypothetical protein